MVATSRGKTTLPDAELEVLACLQRHGAASAAELRAALARQRPMSHGAMMTLLGRLEQKALVARRKAAVGKAFVFHPTRRALTTLRGQPTRLLERVFGGDVVFFMTSLLEGAPPDAEQLDELQALLDDVRRRREGNR